MTNGSYNMLKTKNLIAMAAIVVCAPALLAESEMTQSFELRPGGAFELDTANGHVEVVGTSRSGIRMTVISKQGDPEDDYEFDYAVAKGAVRISVDRIGRDRFWRHNSRNSLRFEIEVPRQTAVRVDTAGGRIVVDGIDGDVEMDTSGGPITGTAINGDVVADTSGGGITLERIRGDVVADTSGGSIQIEDVVGDVEADTSGGSIRIEEVDGDVSADTSGGSIRVDGVTGEVLADTSGGTVSVAFDGRNIAGATLSSSGGGVRVQIDPNASFTIDAAASGGSIDCDIPIEVRGKISKHRLSGDVNGGGPVLTLRASGGTIRIEPR